ncbi:hypothetical protein B0H14DRAFT_2570060 [Mycena olivaceomarginata]|nr:hypothetical protein B0H14DRAFT_2570060 [Mycena olivaceomarginata]
MPITLCGTLQECLNQTKRAFIVLEQLLASREIRRDAGNEGENKDVKDEDMVADAPGKRGKHKWGYSAARKKKKPNGNDTSGEDTPLPSKKQKWVKGGVETEQALQHVSRLCRVVLDDTVYCTRSL